MTYPRIRLSSITLKPDYIAANRLGPVSTRLAKLAIYQTAELMRIK